MTFFYIALAVAVTTIMLFAYNSRKRDSKLLDQSHFKVPVAAEIIPDTFINFGKQRIDNYYWLKDKENPKVIEYLNAENRYTEKVMLSTKELQENIFSEIVGRIKEDDETYPLFRNGFYYYSRTEKGRQYHTYCRRKGSMDASEEIIFDVNQMAEEKPAFIFTRSATRLNGIIDGNYKYIHDITENTDALFDLNSDPDELKNLSLEKPEKTEHYRTISKKWAVCQQKWITAKE